MKVSEAIPSRTYARKRIHGVSVAPTSLNSKISSQGKTTKVQRSGQGFHSESKRCDYLATRFVVGQRLPTISTASGLVQGGVLSRPSNIWSAVCISSRKRDNSNSHAVDIKPTRVKYAGLEADGLTLQAPIECDLFDLSALESDEEE